MAQAARDYLYILRLLKRHPEDSRLQQEAAKFEEFFHSAWYDMLTDVDPEYLINRIKKFVGIGTDLVFDSQCNQDNAQLCAGRRKADEQ